VTLPEPTTFVSYDMPRCDIFVQLAPLHVYRSLGLEAVHLIHLAVTRFKILNKRYIVNSTPRN
jgi:hypothetical protein